LFYPGKKPKSSQLPRAQLAALLFVF